MSLDFKQSNKQSARRYFLYLKAGKIAKSVFVKHKWLSAIVLYLAYRYVKKAGIDFKDIKNFGARLIQIHRRINAIVVEFDYSLAESQIQWISNKLKVDIEPVREVTACLDTAVKQTGADVAWSSNLDGEGVTVAVLDTGINDNHPDLKGAVVRRSDFTGEKPSNGFLSKLLSIFRLSSSRNNKTLDPIGHGTHCAGVIGGRGKQYRGVAPKVALIDVRVLGKHGSGSTDNIVKGMSWASKQGVDIISMSLGGPGNADSALCREADALAKEGIVVVVAAGNEGPRVNTIGSPGSSEQAITVGSVDKQNKLTSYSSRGYSNHRGGKVVKKPDVLAPGGGVRRKGNCVYGDGIISVKSADTRRGSCSSKDSRGAHYEAMSGTSMATPHVAGACALLLQGVDLTHYNAKKCNIIKQVIKETAVNLGYREDHQGAGLLNIPDALDKLKQEHQALYVPTSWLDNEDERLNS